MEQAQSPERSGTKKATLTLLVALAGCGGMDIDKRANDIAISPNLNAQLTLAEAELDGDEEKIEELVWKVVIIATIRNMVTTITTAPEANMTTVYDEQVAAVTGDDRFSEATQRQIIDSVTLELAKWAAGSSAPGPIAEEQSQELKDSIERGKKIIADKIAPPPPVPAPALPPGVS